jgi:hypothetical protein
MQEVFYFKLNNYNNDELVHFNKQILDSHTTIQQ